MFEGNLSVILPFFNEEKTLLQVLQRILKRKEIFEVIAVDDGSSDASAKILEKFLKNNPTLGLRVHLVKHRINCGKGAALISGLKSATGQYLIVQDADLEYSPTDYPKLLRNLMTGKADFVIGNRWGKNKRGYLLAQLGNRYVNILTNLLFGVRLGDSYSGYKIGVRTVWEKLQLSSSGFEIEAEIVAKLAKLKYKIIEVPISYQPRTFAAGKKINWKDVVKATLTLLKIRFR